NGNKNGYIVESSLTWSKTPANNQIMGFDLQINEADSSGRRLGTVNIFDQTGTAWSNPSSIGEIILIGREDDAQPLVNHYKLTSYIKYVEEINPKGYINYDILIEPTNAA